jgi:iron complex outermembrane recepter protein
MKQLCSFCLFVLASLLCAAQKTDSAAVKTDTGFNQTQTIKTVVVAAKKPYVENQVDKTVLNVDSRPTAAGQNALELLRQAPGVVVDGNENISISGKTGVNVLIDGRATEMSGQDLAQLLKSIDAGNIKQVEIITNPAARYDAAGNAGIINIRLKKSLVNGLNGNLAAGIQQSTHSRQSSSSNINFRKDKWNIFANGGYRRGYQVTTANNDRIAAGRSFIQQGDEGDSFWDVSARAGVDYSISKKNVVGILWTGNYHNTTMDNVNHTILQKAGAADTNVFSRSVAPFKNGRSNINLNYKHSGSKTEFNADADFTRYSSSLYNILTSSFADAALIKYADNGTQNNVAVGINLFSVKADYTRQLPKINGRLEAGAKMVIAKTDNNLAVNNAAAGAWLADTGKTNRFDFSENINAAYTSFSGQWKKLSFQAGLRAEQTTIKGVSTDLKGNRITRPDTAYINLFPTVFLQYAIAKNHSIGLSYGRRIDRPGYQDQNPFIYALDAFNSERGNPYLLPQISHGVELGYVYKGEASLKIKYAVTSRLFEQVTYQEGSNTILLPQNTGNRKMLNISLSSPLPITKWWSGYIQAEPFYQRYKGNLTGFGNSNNVQSASWGFNGYIGNWIDIKGGYSLELSGWFNYQNVSTIYKSKPIGSLNTGVKKNILHNKATIKLSVNDIFNTQRWAQTVNNGSLQMSTYRKWESRNIGISFSYRFGNQKIKSARERSTGNADETGRIK